MLSNAVGGELVHTHCHDLHAFYLCAIQAGPMLNPRHMAGCNPWNPEIADQLPPALRIPEGCDDGLDKP